MDNLRVFTNKTRSALNKKVDRKEIAIRDLREKFYMKDDAYFNGWARKCGSAASHVYDALCRYANMSDQTCYPSIPLMADKIGISERQVTRGLKTLEAYRIVIVEREKGMRNVYLLTDKSSWKADVSFTQRGPARRATKCEKAGVKVTWEGDRMRSMSERGRGVETLG